MPSIHFSRFNQILSSIALCKQLDFSNCNFIDTPLICGILKNQNTSFFYFYFTNENITIEEFYDIQKLIYTAKVCKYEIFFEKIKINMENFFDENFYGKEEYHIIEFMVIF